MARKVHLKVHYMDGRTKDDVVGEILLQYFVELHRMRENKIQKIECIWENTATYRFI